MPSPAGPTRPFFPVPEQEAELLTEAERYLVEVRRQQKALPAFTTVHNPYPTGPTARLSLAAPAGPSHPFEPTEPWRQTFLRRFLDLRANLSHPLTQPNPTSDPSHQVPKASLPVPRANDQLGWKRYMLGEKRRRRRQGRAGVGGARRASRGDEAEEMGDGIVVEGLEVDDDEAEADAVNDGSAPSTTSRQAGPSIAPPPTLAPPAPTAAALAADDEEEAALNDGLDLASSSSVVEADALWSGDDDTDDDEDQPMTAQEAFDAFEFGGWYDPSALEPAGGGGGRGVEEDGGGGESESDEDDDEVDESELEPLEERHRGREPSLSLIQGFSDKTTLAALSHISALISSASPPSFPPLLARWAFALLAHLDPPSRPPPPTPTPSTCTSTSTLSADQLSTLRSLARAALAVVVSHAEGLAGALTQADGDGREGEGEGGWWVGPQAVEERVGGWMIWAAVVGVWGQRDLEDEMRAALGGRHKRPSPLPTGA